MTLTCCTRHAAGIPLVGDDVAIRCGDLTAEDIGTLRAAAEDAQARAADPDVGVLYWRSDVPAIAAALLATLEQLARVTGERDEIARERDAAAEVLRLYFPGPSADIADAARVTLTTIGRIQGEREAALEERDVLRAELAALRPAPRAPVDDRAEVADGRAPFVVADGPLDID